MLDIAQGFRDERASTDISVVMDKNRIEAGRTRLFHFAGLEILQHGLPVATPGKTRAFIKVSHGLKVLFRQSQFVLKVNISKPVGRNNAW